MRVVAFWHALAGPDPLWRSFDATLVPSAALARGHPRGLWGVTMRRRGVALFRRPQARPPPAWRRGGLATPPRRPPHVREGAAPPPRRGAAGALRQVAVDGLGHSPWGVATLDLKTSERGRPTLFLSPHPEKGGEPRHD